MTIPIQEMTKILVDAHVHIHRCFDLENLLDAALANFDQVSQLQSEPYVGVLLTADIGPRTWLDHFSDKILDSAKSLDFNSGKRWVLLKTREPYSFKAYNCDGRTIVIILGRQIVTEEAIEVLGLMTEKDFAEHLPLKKTLHAIVSSGALPVLPWGVGKWIGRRGSLLRGFLETEQTSSLFLGDNSGRPTFWLRPVYFQQAERKGIGILPGTDPLPLKEEYRRVGSFGFKLMGSLSEDCPAASLKRLLDNSSQSIEPYGDLETPLRFFRNQLMLRLS